jgi:hypothetical protein
MRLMKGLLLFLRNLLRRDASPVDPRKRSQLMGMYMNEANSSRGSRDKQKPRFIQNRERA